MHGRRWKAQRWKPKGSVNENYFACISDSRFGVSFVQISSYKRHPCKTLYMQPMHFQYSIRTHLSTGRIVRLVSRWVEALGKSGPLWKLCVSSELRDWLHPSQKMLTVNSLSILFLLAIENGVFVLWQHLLLGWHLLLPALNWLDLNALLGQCLVDNRNNGVDSTKALTLAGLLVAGESPWDLPVVVLGSILIAPPVLAPA